MTPIKFGTDGWRAIIADTYTNDNVARVAKATALWLKKHFDFPSVVMGFDCRFGGLMFSEVATRILCAEGVKVYYDPNFSTTPMVSLGVLKLNACAGVVITASHNPPAYNGYKLKAHFGGPALPDSIKEVESLLPNETVEIPDFYPEKLQKEGLLEYINLEDLYVNEIEKSFDMEAIRASGIKVGYDAMYGAGQNVMRRLLPDVVALHCDYNPSFKGQAPEPIRKNLGEFAELIKNSSDIAVGIANDGDADRIGMLDSKGNFVDSHHLILLLTHYLHKYKGYGGKVVVAFSVTDRIKRMCEAYGLPVEVTQIGFKHVCGIMVKEDVILGGEESGGIAVKGHVPERDGIWTALLMLEFMAKTGKTLQQLIEEVYEVTGSFDFERSDLHITNELKLAIMENCKANKYTAFGKYKVQRVENIDGYKYHLSDNAWVMIRPSGTEPVLRVYAEAHDLTEVRNILKTVTDTLTA